MSTTERDTCSAVNAILEDEYGVTLDECESRMTFDWSGKTVREVVAEIARLEDIAPCQEDEDDTEDDTEDDEE